ncbi:hypothetical protein NEOLEDRAFT_1184318 [Neolentinus lepideus HHB14362 ss-1]|uniref:Uncharacterized protein n=1 Tax=Neolentinus lepideus HHB14362 ss-1 TaxID=1314782 RepID=A0A165MJV7_9AGAM|nr:hypothetical protein NEOLEDRAFT_1184318 [Neolentinus lepideus HHB14362 ss-1]
MRSNIKINQTSPNKPKAHTFESISAGIDISESATLQISQAEALNVVYSQFEKTGHGQISTEDGQVILHPDIAQALNNFTTATVSYFIRENMLHDGIKTAHAREVTQDHVQQWLDQNNIPQLQAATAEQVSAYFKRGSQEDSDILGPPPHDVHKNLKRKQIHENLLASLKQATTTITIKTDSPVSDSTTSESTSRKKACKSPKVVGNSSAEGDHSLIQEAYKPAIPLISQDTSRKHVTKAMQEDFNTAGDTQSGTLQQADEQDLNVDEDVAAIGIITSGLTMQQPQNANDDQQANHHIAAILRTSIFGDMAIICRPKDYNPFEAKGESPSPSTVRQLRWMVVQAIYRTYQKDIDPLGMPQLLNICPKFCFWGEHQANVIIHKSYFKDQQRFDIASIPIRCLVPVSWDDTHFHYIPDGKEPEAEFTRAWKHLFGSIGVTREQEYPCIKKLPSPNKPYLALLHRYTLYRSPQALDIMADNIPELIKTLTGFLLINHALKGKCFGFPSCWAHLTSLCLQLALLWTPKEIEWRISLSSTMLLLQKDIL